MTVQNRVNSETLLANGNRIVRVNLTTASPTYSMKVGDNVLHAISAAADGVGIVTLPSVAEAAGQFYCIVAPTGAAGGDISLYVKETGAELTTNGDMDADDDHILLYSDGVNWRTVLDGVA